MALYVYVGEEEIETLDTLEQRLHCPKCTTDLSTNGFESAYWVADEIVYFCWCHHCSWIGEITEFSGGNVTSSEPVEDDGPGRPHLEIV